MLRFTCYLVTVLVLLRSICADTCTSVEALGYINITYVLDLTYIEEQTQYWSTSCSALLPSCIIFPTTVEENLDQANLGQRTGIVDVGPGNRLDGISAKLQGSGWTFVGGRIGNTGVGGLVLGGGLSYMFTQYGWAASSVLEFEIVFANGTIGHITRDNDLDFFRALKGGGNNFGIVTNYKLQAHPQGDIWGGNLVYLRTPKNAEQLQQAVRDFTEYSEDERAAVIVTAERANINVVDSWIIFLFYDRPSPPAGLFGNFTDVNTLLDTTRMRTYADIMALSNWFVIKGNVVDIATETIPLPSSENGIEVMRGLHDHWRNISSTALLVPSIVASIAWQPFPKKIAQRARELSPDIIDADADVDRIIVEMNYAFTPQSLYDPMADTIEATYIGIRNRVDAWQTEGKLSDACLPLFMNYGFYRQGYFGRLRPENQALAKRVAENVDPNGMFRSRTGAWKP